MAAKKADLLLHPVRLRIATELSNRAMTPRQLATALPDVPQATLYRQINTLLEGGLLEVVAENPVNGAVEYTYQLKPGAERISPDEFSRLSVDEHVAYFNVYLASLLETFTRYIHHADPEDFKTGNVSYNHAVIYLNDAEREEFRAAVMQVIMQVATRPPAPDRRRYTLASLVIPDERETPS